MDFKELKKGQVTLFVILALIILISIIALFILMNNMSNNKTQTINPKQYIEDCISSKLNDPIEKIIIGGGTLNPSFFILYQGEEYNYLCYSANIFERCVNLYPQLRTITEQNIKDYIEEETRLCFDKLKDIYVSQGFDFKEKDQNINVNILPGKVLVNVNKEVEIIKENDTQIFNSFSTSLNNNIYEFLNIANGLVNEEARLCNFEYNGYMLGYPDYDIRIIRQDSTKIYKIVNRKTEEEFRFAVKGCVYPQGELK
jgi:hypothetical protein